MCEDFDIIPANNYFYPLNIILEKSAQINFPGWEADVSW